MNQTRYRSLPYFTVLYGSLTTYADSIQIPIYGPTVYRSIRPLAIAKSESILVVFSETTVNHNQKHILL